MSPRKSSFLTFTRNLVRRCKEKQEARVCTFLVLLWICLFYGGKKQTQSKQSTHIPARCIQCTSWGHSTELILMLQLALVSCTIAYILPVKRAISSSLEKQVMFVLTKHLKVCLDAFRATASTLVTSQNERTEFASSSSARVSLLVTFFISPL